MATLYEQAQAYREALLRGDRQAAAALIRSYGAAYQRLGRELDSVRGAIAKARDAGLADKDIPALLYREGRIQVLAEKVRTEITKFAGDADIIVGGAIDVARTQGAEHAGQLLQMALPEGVAVSPATTPGSPLAPVVPESIGLATGATTQVTAATQAGAPVGQLLASLGPEAAKSVTDALVSSIAVGKNPNVVAREIRTALGGNLTRALTIARTETLRAYREASRAEYMANADVLRGWIWTADLSNRTCAACWAQHGSVHPLGEIMATHPRCRCSMVPATRSWKELGFGSTPESVQIQEGPAIFRRLPESDQRAILGDAKYRAYAGRQITLPDLVAKRESPVWGPSTSEAGLGAAKDNAAARRLGDR